MPSFNYPVVALIDRESRLSAYVALDHRDLASCPLHEHFRNKRALHTLIDSQGNAYRVHSPRVTGIDWQRARDVGLGAQLLSAIFSLGNVPVLVQQSYEPVAPVSIDEIRLFLLQALKQRPQLYTTRRSERAVKASITKASSVRELAAAISIPIT